MVNPMNKSGIFRTIEAFIAIFITFGFLIVFLPQQRDQSQHAAPRNPLEPLGDNLQFRTCIILQNTTCINQSIGKNVPDTYSYVFNLSDNPNAVVNGLPNKRVYSNSLFIAGNTTNATHWIVRLYLWTKE